MTGSQRSDCPIEMEQLKTKCLFSWDGDICCVRREGEGDVGMPAGMRAPILPVHSCWTALSFSLLLCKSKSSHVSAGACRVGLSGELSVFRGRASSFSLRKCGLLCGRLWRSMYEAMSASPGERGRGRSELYISYNSVFLDVCPGPVLCTEA